MRMAALLAFIAAFAPDAPAAAKGGIKNARFDSRRLLGNVGTPCKVLQGRGQASHHPVSQGIYRSPGEVRRRLGERDTQPEGLYLLRPVAVH